VPPVPKEPDTGRFTKEDFVVDVEKDAVTCPGGKTTRWFIKNKQTTKRGNVFHNLVFQFTVEECRKCPLMEHCVKSGEKRWSVNLLGLCEANYLGTKKVFFQLAMVAAVANFTLVTARAANLSPSFSVLIYVSLLVATTTLLSSIASQRYFNIWSPAGRTHHCPIAFTNMGFQLGF